MNGEMSNTTSVNVVRDFRPLPVTAGKEIVVVWRRKIFVELGQGFRAVQPNPAGGFEVIKCNTHKKVNEMPTIG